MSQLMAGSAESGREAARARRRAIALYGGQGASSGTPPASARRRRETPPAATQAVAETAERPSVVAPAASVPKPVSGPGEAAPVAAPRGAAQAALQNGRSAGADSDCESTNAFCRRRRQVLSQQGGGALAPPVVARRRRRADEGAPPKVETGTTLAGRPVTGNQVERTPLMTGHEAGTCRTVTGTEYVGSEQYADFCATRPAPAAAKVGMSVTSREQPVSGATVGRSVKVTGDEYGSCKSVTGTEYLGQEHFAQFCQGEGVTKRPEKVSSGLTVRRQVAVTGSGEVHVGRATGTEAGAARPITGAQYADLGASRLTINGPSKVALTHTVAGRPVSGTAVDRSVKITGDEAGSCRAISGTEYLSNEQFQTVCRVTAPATPAKVGEDASRSGQRITGNILDRTVRMTGTGPGSSQRVTGSQYQRDAGSRAASSGTGAADRSGEDRPAGSVAAGPGAQAAASSAPATGSRAPILSGALADDSRRVTGTAAGQTRAITGTVYAGSRISPESSSAAMESAPRARDDGARRERITGSAYGDAARITGPVSRAAGLVSGTPEFRYRDEFTAPAGTDPVPAPAPAAAGVAAAPASRVTGAGRETGQRITGDDWMLCGRVTGIAGPWSQGRNPTFKGQARSAGATAWRNSKKAERAEVPPAKITGSSGNAGKGALITVSGGARG